MTTLRLRNSEPVKPEPEGPKPVCHVTFTGKIKGHPPVTIAVFGRSPKDGIRDLRELLAHGTYKVNP